MTINFEKCFVVYSHPTHIPSLSTWTNNVVKEIRIILDVIDRILFHKWSSKVTIIVNNDYVFEVDSGASLNCIKEGIIPTKYYEKTTERLSSANGIKSNENRLYVI
jgi:hypothetical protein